MDWDSITKYLASLKTESNLGQYDSISQSISWETAYSELDGVPGNTGLNIAWEAGDRHALGPRADRIAIRWLRKGEQRRDYTYADLRAESNRFANVLAGLGVLAGDTVFTLTGRNPELDFLATGTWKNRIVYSPLFSAFGPEPIRQRLERSQAKLLVTTESLYRRKVAGIRESLPNLEHVLIVRDRSGGKLLEGTLDFQAFHENASADFTIGPTDPEDIPYFTSRSARPACRSERSKFTRRRWLVA